MKAITQDKIARLGKIIESSSRITIVAHSHPDGDAVGCCISLLHFLTDIAGKDARIVLTDPEPGSVSFIIPEEDRRLLSVDNIDHESALKSIHDSDLIFCLDCNGFSRIDSLRNVLTGSGATKVLIDHHPGPESDDFDLVFSETAVSSASELLFYILMEMPQIGHDACRIPKVSATALMTGMTTDTNNFGNSVFPGTLQMASELLEAGVDRDFIISELYNQYRENRIRLMGYLLYEKLTITDKGVAYMILDIETRQKYDIQEGETDAFVNIPLAIGRVRMSIFLKEEGGQYRVSIRSKAGTSANLCARTYFNGGGHELAAGGKLSFPQDENDMKDNHDLSDKGEAAAYIEKVTEEFLK